MRRIWIAPGAGFLATVIIAASVVQAAPSPQRRARAGVRFLVSQQEDNGSIPAFSPVGSTADAVVAMVAARRAPGAIGDALDYLKRQIEKDKVEGVGLVAKIAMAVVAGGRNPRRFGGSNLVKFLMDSQQTDGQYGDGSDGLAVTSHELAMLALVGAGGQVPQNASTWLLDAQCPDGGWQFDAPFDPGSDDEHCQSTVSESDFSQSDTNTTAQGVMALAAAGSADPAADPFAFFDELRDQVKNGWGFDRAFSITDSNSTALVIQAYVADDRTLPDGAFAALRALQFPLCKEKGAFAFTWQDDDGDGQFRRTPPDTGATIGALLGLLKKPLPVEESEVTKPAPRIADC